MQQQQEQNGKTPRRNRPEHLRKPEWLKVRLGAEAGYATVSGTLGDESLHTICQSGACPNLGECWRAGTATVMILGDVCTRSCRFCAVRTGRPLPPDPEEPVRVARAIARMKLRHAVITSVDRDDLPDGGAALWAETVQAVRTLSPGTTMETLVPDFKGCERDIRTVVEASPEVISHNIETVERLTPQVRVQARYRRSLEVLRLMKSLGAPRTKSGLMLGLGETPDEVLATLNDLRQAGVDIVTIGQYLQPTRRHLPVQQYVHPDQFARYGQYAREIGFRAVQSGPLVRSSYHAHTQVFAVDEAPGK